MVEFTKERPLEGSFLVYFNGIEIPANSVTVNMGVWMIPTANVSVAPDKELQRLGAEDRVQVAIFYLDNYYTELTGQPPDFRLLFDGEILGWSYSNTAAGRTMNFRCSSFLRILDDLYPFFMTGLDTLITGTLREDQDPQMKTAAKYGPLFPASLLYTGLDTTTGKAIRRPYDFVENAIRACVGQTEQQKFASVVATNFFARYMRRTGFDNRFLPSPILEIDHMRVEDDSDPEGIFPILRYVRWQDTLDTLTKQVNQVGNGNSIWGLIKDTFQRMYYEVAAITTAPIAQVHFTSGIRGEVVGPPSFTTEQKEAQTTASTVGSVAGTAFGVVAGVAAEAGVRQTIKTSKPNRLINFVTKPQWHFGIPPTCNAIFPSMITQFTFEEQYADQPTRLYVDDEWLVDALKAGGKLREFAIPAVGYPDQVQEELERRESVRGIGNLGISGKNFLVWPEEYFKGPITARETLRKWFQMLMQSSQRPTRHAVKPSPLEQDPVIIDQFDLDAPIDEDDGKLVEGATDPNTTLLGALANAGINTVSRLDAVKAKLMWLKRVYARKEFYRRRASFRSGVVATIFNPYMVPAFPVPVFDDLSTGNHVMGYVATLSHHLTQRSQATTVRYTHAQTLDEYLHQIHDARTGDNPEMRQYKITAAPADPVPELRVITQVYKAANQYFRDLFHQKQEYGSALKTAAFDITSAIKLKLKSGETVSVSDVLGFGTDTAAAAATESAAGTVFGAAAGVAAGVGTRQATKASRLDRLANSRIVPEDNFAPMFDQAAFAMRHVSRPICTLEEYINFHEKGVREGRVEPNDKVQGKGAVFYEKILNLEQGPGTPPVIDEDNNLAEPVTADTRADWETRLKNYRTKILFQLHPQEY